MTHLNAPHFTTETEARKLIENLRWPNGPVCGHCGETVKRYATKREGRYRCGNPACRKDYSVTTGTVMESSHIQLHKWLSAFYLVCSSKKGISAHQLHRTLQITYKSAWFLEHRIREAMREGGLVPPLGGEGGVVEADETYFGKQENPQPSPARKGRPYIHKGGGPAGKRAVVALVERGGRVRSFHPGVADGVTVAGIVRDNIARETRLMTDESRLYIRVGKEFTSHETVVHSRNEYVRGDVYTNTVNAGEILQRLAGAKVQQLWNQ